jgi:membrane protease YdiL (CAAX protease family)
VTALALLLIVPVSLWVGQTAFLLACGRRPTWQISPAGAPDGVRVLNRTVTYVSVAAVLLLYPLVTGRDWAAYYGGLFPLDERVRLAGIGAAMGVLYLALLYLAWLLSDNITFRVRHSGRRIAKRLLLAGPLAVFVALFEELLFRGVVLADLQRSLPPVLAVLIAVAIFAGAHYVRRVKRYWTFAGHVALGLLFCIAYVLTGALWLSAGLHAGGVFGLMAARPFIRYTGPAWLVGASVFPYAGVVGIAALLAMALNVWFLCPPHGE